ncbi:MAG: lactate permease [Gammaproteobacteria bacterium]|nr:MAG: lactate permease [Gammaproteobacteria bacterium]
MSLLVSILPIALLILLMVKKNGLPSYIALPLIAVLVYILQLTYFKSGLTVVNANVISGMIATLTPITIIFGAILFNRMMEVSGGTDILRKWLGNISNNPVAQLMIIGWAFAFMIEGASGFGTPAAIAAPILMGLGFKALRVAVFALMANTVPVSFGAVGTPTWFGFEPLNLSEAMTMEIGQVSALIHCVAALVIPILALLCVIDWMTIRRNLIYIYLSILSCTVPYFLIAQLNYEFPALVGGAIGMLISIGIAKLGIGLAKNKGAEEKQAVSGVEVFKAMFPTAMLIGILVVTRIPQLGIKGLLTDSTEWLSTSLSGLGTLEISQSLIIALNNILGTGVASSYKTLYVPSLIPFVVTVVLCLFLFRLSGSQSKEIFGSSWQQVKKPFLALLGALIMVKLMLTGGEKSMVITIGTGFADLTGANWTYFSSYLGAIGSFFSGSNTVSNLTFGGIQLSIAETTGLSIPLILALQSVGGAMGNMVCLNNIIAVCGVLNVTNQEGAVLRKTVGPTIVYGIVAGLVAFVLIRIGYVS